MIRKGSHGYVICRGDKAEKTLNENITFLRELVCVKLLKHPNITEYYDIDIEEKIISMKYYKHTLSDCILGFITYDLKKILIELMDVLTYLKSQNICHRDIKPNNILMSSDTSVILCDWSLARCMSDNSHVIYTGEVESEWYRAPELSGKSFHYDEKIDVYAIGVILIQFYLKNIHKITKRHRNIVYRSSSTPNTPNTLTFKMLKNNPLTRFSIKDVQNYLNVSANVYEQPLLFIPLRGIIYQKQKEINTKMRHILVEWLYEVRATFEISFMTFTIAVHIIDNILRSHEIKKKHFQLFGITAMYIASSYFDINPLSMSMCSYITDDTFTENQISRCNVKILSIMTEYDVFNNTEYHILLNIIKDCSEKFQLLAMNICDLCQIKFHYKIICTRDLAYSIANYVSVYLSEYISIDYQQSDDILQYIDDVLEDDYRYPDTLPLDINL